MLARCRTMSQGRQVRSYEANRVGLDCIIEVGARLRGSAKSKDLPNGDGQRFVHRSNLQLFFRGGG